MKLGDDIAELSMGCKEAKTLAKFYALPGIVSVKDFDRPSWKRL